MMTTKTLSKNRAAMPSSGPKTFVIEVGPIEYFAATKSDLREMERDERRRLEQYARMVVGVGPYSKVVRVRTEQNTGTDPQ